MATEHSEQLPIVEVLETMREAFTSHDELVLQAPPGAGKTTMVPLALLSEPWLDDQVILMLEPRRMAAQASAKRMAQMLGEEVGDTVGYRIRLDNCVGPNTRIEVITEGILTRRLQSDPALDGVGLLIFDEFHERNLNSDLGLALTLQGREFFREGKALKILVMSATLDGEAVADLLGDAPIVTSHGRQFPVEVSYGRAHKLRDSITTAASQIVLRALKEHVGNILVFLPGQREIVQLAKVLSGATADDNEIMVAPLYGGLSLAKQHEAIEAPPEGFRKIVLATNIAETSLTIEGINTVVDSGLVREAVFDAPSGMTRLATRRISRASAEQRMGRAGRLAPGQCYRLWSEEQQAQLSPQSTPEILQADLAPLTLQLLAWGVENPADLVWLNLPPAGAFSQSLATLVSCGAVQKSDSGQYQLSVHGMHMAEMPLHPRLAHMLLLGDEIDELESASLLAAVLSERNPLANGEADIAHTLAVLKGETPCHRSNKGWFKRTWTQAKRFQMLAEAVRQNKHKQHLLDKEELPGLFLATAYPDRVAKLRSKQDRYEYQLANGRSARLNADDTLAGSPWLAVGEVGGRVGEVVDRIYSASTLNPEHFEQLLAPSVVEKDCVYWDENDGRFIAEQRRLLGKIILSATPISDVTEEDRLSALVDLVRKNGLSMLPWSNSTRQWQARVMLLRQTELQLLEFGEKGHESRWPDLSDEHLLATLEQWLSPFLFSVLSMADFHKLNLKSILQSLLPWPLPLDLERLAPERLVVPSGSNIAVDYLQSPPVLEVKLQEMFGCDETPSVADGQVPLQIHLLSPARRPLQITQDLAGFWRSSYQDVKKEMKGRYPKHPWPDDPLGAEATRYTKQRLENV